jgi:hypothetical protein
VVRIRSPTGTLSPADLSAVLSRASPAIPYARGLAALLLSSAHPRAARPANGGGRLTDREREILC